MEVIDLVSSSPPRAEVKQHASISKADFAVRTTLDFGSDEFDFSRDLDFPLEQRSKRPKLSHPPQLPTIKGSLQSNATFDSRFELSSDGDILPCAKASQLPKAGLTKKVAAIVDEWDEVRFSSSAPEPLHRASSKRMAVFDLSSDSAILEEGPIQSSSQPGDASKSVFSQTTANLLANIRSNHQVTKISDKPSASYKSRRAASAEEARNDRFKMPTGRNLDDIVDSSQSVQPHAPKKTTNASGKHGKQTKSSAQQLAKEQKETAKEAERQRKQREKEGRQKEKQRAADIAEVNKSKTNKKNSTPEMFIHVPSTIRGLSVCNQVEEYMKELGVQVTFTGINEVPTSSIPEIPTLDIITWKRKVTAEYDEDHEIWQPLAQPRVSTEDHVLVYVKAEEFVSLAISDKLKTVTNAADVSEEVMKLNLNHHVASLRALYPNCRLIYLIEGLSAWLKKSVNAKNRAYTAAVRAQVAETTSEVDHDDVEMVDEHEPGNPPPSAQRRKPKSTTTRRKKNSNISQIDLSSITETITEGLLLHLQIHHQPLLIYQTTSAKTSAAQISAFTQHLSTRPYRLAAQSANLASASFCMTTGQIRTGTTARETWIQMLQEINRVTPSMAYGISSAGFTNPAELVKAFRRDGRLMLEDVRKSTNKDGGWSDRRLGPMVSKRIYKVFMGKDPTAMDGMA